MVNWIARVLSAVSGALVFLTVSHAFVAPTREG